jgi:hypothetical protein
MRPRFLHWYVRLSRDCMLVHLLLHVQGMFETVASAMC